MAECNCSCVVCMWYVYCVCQLICLPFDTSMSYFSQFLKHIRKNNCREHISVDHRLNLDWRLLHETTCMFLNYSDFTLAISRPTTIPIGTRMASDNLSYHCMTRFTAHVLALLADLKSVGLKSRPCPANPSHLVIKHCSPIHCCPARYE